MATHRLQTYLLNSEFQDGQAAGSITASDVRDLIVSVYPSVYNVMNYGAVGNGSSNPASSQYGSLAALQVVYGTTISGVTVALTQELDWLAHQAAINAATVSGGVVYSPAGTYVFTNSNSVSDGSGTLQFPTAQVYGTTCVSWLGDWGGTMCKWNNDLGSANFAVTCGAGARPNNNPSMGSFEGIHFTGPGVGATLGASSTSMQGIATNDRRSLNRLWITGFKVAVNIIGGQAIWKDVTITGAYYGLYFDNPSTANYGNMLFQRVLIQSCNMAAVGVHQNSTIGSHRFDSCFFGVSPYGLFKETNSGSPGNVFITASSEFHMCQFEAVGNAVMSDDINTQSSHVAVSDSSTFTDCEYSWGSSNKLGSRGAFSLFDISTYNSLYLDGINTPQVMTPGSVSMFYGVIVGSVTIRANIDQMIVNCNTAGLPMFAGNWSYGATVLYNNGYPYWWEGTVVYNQDAISAVGDVMIQVAGDALNQTKSATGATSDAVLGVMMHNPTPTGAGSLCEIATRGWVTTNSTGSIGTGVYVRTSATAGTVLAASSAADTTTPIIGICMAAASGGVCTVRLRGLT